MKVLLIQCRTDASAAHELDCVLRHGKLTPDEITIANPVLKPGSLRIHPAQDFDAILMGGSGQFGIVQAADTLAFQRGLTEIRPVLDAVVEGDLPFLGMCLGHQVLAWHIGAAVVADPKQEEVGSFKVTLTEAGKNDPLFTGMPEQFIAQHGHKESVDELPAGAVQLSIGKRNPMSSFRVGAAVYGVQFHPELTLDDLMARLSLYPDYLHGKTVAEARKGFKESPDAPRVLRNFFEHVVAA
ncbi:MAG: gamma-glutamyl-gamma-aminobutyrate hydrolase family protein [Patescibacteria group bacterium]